MPHWLEEVVLALALGGVLLLEGRADLAVIAFDGGEGRIGEPFASSAGVTPSRELPTRMFWSR